MEWLKSSEGILTEFKSLNGVRQNNAHHLKKCKWLEKN